MSSNPWKKFEKLIAGDPLNIVTVMTHNSDGTSTVQTLGGGSMTVRGQEVAPGLKAFVKDGEMKGAAPNLTFYELEV